MNAGLEDFDPFRGGEIARVAPSTEPQREVIASAMMSAEANTAFNEAVSLTIEGALEPAAIESALRGIVERHDALRMTFTRSGEELCVTDENRFSLEIVDIGGGEADAGEPRLRELWTELVSTPMDLTHGPLFRAIFVRRGPERAELILLAHHVICDGWSFSVLLEELSSMLAEPPRALEPAVSFADFAERQAAEAASNADIDFWLDRFQQLPPPLELPLDRPRPLVRGFRAERTDFIFDPELTAAIRTTAGKIRASVVNVALGGLALLLHRLCGVEDLVIGLPVARQSTANLESLVGHGVQLLPIRLKVEPGEPFAAVVARARSAVLDAQEHPGFTFGTLVRELGLSGDGSRVPLIPVVFNIDQPLPPMSLGGASAVVRTVPRVAENFEIFLNVLPTAESLVVEATFNSGLFDEASIRAWLGALRSILLEASRDPQKSVSEIVLTHDLLEPYRRLNDTAREHASDVWLEELARHAAASPEAPAVADAAGQLTYAELDRRSSQLAYLLHERGIGAGDLVALHLERSAGLLVAIAGVHKSGAGYVPLDPGFPESRLEFMLRDSGAKLILTDSELPPALAACGVPPQALPLPADEHAPVELPRVRAEDIAYVIYTSGSTGKPKGVRVHHGAVANFLHAMAEQPGLSSADRLLAVTTLSFDISVLELLLPLLCGASVYVAAKDQAGDARQLEQLLETEDITIMQATPATWRLLLANGWRGSRRLKCLCGGEPLPLDLAQKLATRVASLWNLYGPTETTIWSTCRRIASDCERVTVGRPIDNTEVYVLAEDGALMPPAIPGELCIGGAGVAQGYLNRPELTADRFVQHPEFGRFYRTGDKARLLAGGDLEHLGRLDDQVKVRGFRIELGEIEAVLQEQPDVARAAVHVWQAKPGDLRIVACCVPEAGRSIAPIKLRKGLRSRLPEYMVPQYFLAVEAIPLTPNGKIDRRSLPVPVVSDSRIGQREAPATPVETAIAEIWTALVKPERPIGREDRFFEIGGHSLLGLEALRQMEERFGTRLHARILYQENLAGIARQCGDEARAIGEAAASRPAPLPENARRLLSDMQEFIHGNVSRLPNACRYHVPFSFRIAGALDVPLFEASLKHVFARHAVLRSVVAEDDEGACLSLIHADEACRLHYVDLRHESDGEAAALRAMVAATREALDVRQGPLVRLQLLQLAGGEHVFFFMPHQLVFDGWSFDLFLRELDRAYTHGGRPDDPPLALDFPDYAVWQRTRAGATPAAAFWETELRDPLPPLAWPGSAKDDAPARLQFRIPAEQIQRAEALCKQGGVKLQNLLLAVFVRVLGAAAGREELMIGLAASGRYLPETAAMIGPFYRNLPLRLRSSPERDLLSAAAAIEQRVDAAADHQDVPYWTLAELAGSAEALSALGRIAFSFQEARGRNLELGGIPLHQISVPRPGMEADLEFWMRNTPECLIASFDYRSGLAEQALIEALRDDFVQALDTLTAGGGAPVSYRSAGRLGSADRPRPAGGRDAALQPG